MKVNIYGSDSKQTWEPKAEEVSQERKSKQRRQMSKKLDSEQGKKSKMIMPPTYVDGYQREARTNLSTDTCVTTLSCHRVFGRPTLCPVRDATAVQGNA